LSRKLIEPIGESKPVWWIYAELGRRMGFEEEFPWKTDKEVVDHMLAPSGLSVDQLESIPEGVFHSEKKYGMENIRLHTPSKKIELYSESLKEMGEAPLPEYVAPTQSPSRNPELNKKYPLILVTGIRTPEFTNYQFRNIPQLRRLCQEPFAWVNPATGKKYGITDGAMIRVESRNAAIQARVQFMDEMKPGVVGVQHGWEYEQNPNKLNELDDVDPVTGYAEFRNIACRIEMV
jgi:anaerobic selenocysteine-containing dehydrogenase